MSSGASSGSFEADLPSGWREVRIGDALEHFAERAELRGDVQYDLISIRRRHGGMFHRERLPGRAILTKNVQRVVPGSFVIARRQIVHGACAIAAPEFDGSIMSMSYSAFRGSPICDARYFFALAQQPHMVRYFWDCSHGVVVEKLNFQQEEWLDCLIRLPPLGEQRRIAEILDTTDEAIQATERLIIKLRVALVGLIDASFCARQSNVTSLESVCVDTAEYGCVAAAQPIQAGWPRYVRITDVTERGTLRRDSVMGVAPAVAQNAILRPGDIVFARSGATVGKTYLYDPADGLCAFAGYMIRFVPDSGKVLPEFVRWWTHSSAYWGWVKRTMREGAQPNINAREFAQATLPLPPLEEQRRVVEGVGDLDATLSTELARCDKLRRTRDGLAADLLSGRVRTVAA